MASPRTSTSHPPSHNILHQVKGIGPGPPHESHFPLAPLHDLLHHRSYFQLSGTQKRHSALQTVKVSLVLDLALGAIRCEIVSQVLHSVVGAIGGVIAVLDGWVSGVAEANDEFPRCIVQRTFVKVLEGGPLT